jgi:putative flippase GtrA
VTDTASQGTVDERPVATRRATLAQWARHHVAAIAGTAADYSVMVGCVELGRLPPVTATVLGALTGAVVNLTLGLRYTYRVPPGAVGSYAWRYALVSAASLGWNAAGEALLHGVLGLQYILARVITSFVVSNAWNYPMQRFFVFSIPRSSPTVARRP